MITPFHAFLNLGKYWCEQDRSGISVPFAVAYWKWLHGDNSWGKEDLHTVRELVEKIYDRKSLATKLFGETLVLYDVNCADVGCTVFKVMSKQWADDASWWDEEAEEMYFPANCIREFENFNNKPGYTLNSYKGCIKHGPSRDWEQNWNPLSDEDFHIFRDATILGHEKIRELAMKSGVLKPEDIPPPMPVVDISARVGVEVELAIHR